MEQVRLRSKRIQILSALAISSGMPLGFVWVTMQFFLVDLSIPKATIGLLSGVSLPWTLKFLWSPLVDRYALRWPGRRRSWVLLTQVGLAAAFGGFALLAWWLLSRAPADRPPSTPLLIGLMAMLIAFISATQDIAYDAYCVEALEPAEQGPVSGLKILYYRIGMLLTGAFAVSAAAADPGARSAALSTHTPAAMFRACRDFSPIMFGLPFKFYRTVTFT